MCLIGEVKPCNLDVRSQNEKIVRRETKRLEIGGLEYVLEDTCRKEGLVDTRQKKVQ